MANSAGLRIRPGTARDIQVIWTLIRGLAAYERRRHAVKATARRLRRDGFGRRPYFKTLICLRDREPVGFALYFFAYSTFLGRPILYLEDLFVVPRDRGRGAGKALLAALAAVAVRAGCGRMAWSVLRWNAPAIAFYRRLGAGSRDAWTLMSLSGPALRRLARGHVADGGATRRARRRTST
ncbi:MAG TPA: GNAT family N-acetyltransferase [bacterium]|nr:GNAT family N-acetyltransferase [bacterium]